MDYYALSQKAIDLAYQHIGEGRATRAEATLLTYLAEDDGSLEFLTAVKIPILHVLGRICFSENRFLSAKRYLRDAFVLSQAFPGNMPAQDDEDRAPIQAFLRSEVGLEMVE